MAYPSYAYVLNNLAKAPNRFPRNRFLENQTEHARRVVASGERAPLRGVSAPRQHHKRVMPRNGRRWRGLGKYR